MLRCLASPLTPLPLTSACAISVRARPNVSSPNVESLPFGALAGKDQGGKGRVGVAAYAHLLWGCLPGCLPTLIGLSMLLTAFTLFFLTKKVFNLIQKCIKRLIVYCTQPPCKGEKGKKKNTTL